MPLRSKGCSAPLQRPQCHHRSTNCMIDCWSRDSNNLIIRSPHQVHRRLLFAKSRSHQQAVSKTESLKSSEASPGLGPSPAESNKCIITLSSFEVLDFFETVIRKGFLVQFSSLAGTYSSASAVATNNETCELRQLQARSFRWDLWQC